MNTPHRYIRRRAVRGRTTKIVLASTMAAIIAGNVIVALVFHNRTYPGAQVGGKPAGNMAYSDIMSKLGEYIPTTVSVTYKKRTLPMQVSNFGISLDRHNVTKSLNSSRAWPPATNFFITQSAELPIVINQATFDAGFAAVQKAYEQQPVPPSLVREDYIFRITTRVPGILLDKDQFKRDLIAALKEGRSKVEVPITPTTPDQLKAADEQYQWQQLIYQQNTAITYNYLAISRRLTPREVGMWYVLKGKTWVLDDTKIEAKIVAVGKEMGITVTNLPEAVAATKDAVTTHQSLAFSLLTITPPQ